MESRGTSQSIALHTRTRTVLKYAARATLGAIVLYAFLGSSTNAPVHGIAQRHSDTTAAIPTYWSMPSAPEAAATPDSVKKVDIPASPEPEELASSKSAEGGGAKETVLDENENVDEFIKRLFEEDGIPLPDDLKPPAPAQPAQTPLSEEEKAEIQRLKDVETKEKRADITNRHTKWEKKLAKAGEAELMELMERVTAMRKGVVDNMRSKPEMFDLLKTMQEDGFKQVENTDKFLQKMQKDGEKGEEHAGKWSKVVGAVQKRLDSRTIDVTTYLQKWYKDVMQKEKEVFEASAEMIDKLADEAQADIGMDYAWLDDVTTDDWTRYHKLKDEAKKWIEQFETVYNSTHVLSENIVVTELVQVETAMMRVAADLNQALDQVRMRGDGWLKGESETDTPPRSSEDGASHLSMSGTSEPAPEKTEEPGPSPPYPMDNVHETTLPVPETNAPAAQKHLEL